MRIDYMALSGTLSLSSQVLLHKQVDWYDWISNTQNNLDIITIWWGKELQNKYIVVKVWTDQQNVY